MDNNTISIVIPIYNEEKSIRSTVERIKELDNSKNYELILVNDGSDDDTHSIITEMLDGEIIYIKHSSNKGYGASLKTGIRAAKHQNIAIIDADGTYPVEKLNDLLSVLVTNRLDMVVGSRNGLNVSYPLIKKIPKYFIIKLANYISGVKIPDINSGLRIFKKETAMHFFHLYPQGFSFTTTITMSMLCGGYDVEFVPIDYYEREGKSKIRPIRDTINFFTLLVKMAMYYNPFKFFAPITIIFAFISIFTVTKDFSRGDLSESSVLFPMATLLFLTLGLLADLIVKRSS